MSGLSLAACVGAEPVKESSPETGHLVGEGWAQRCLAWTKPTAQDPAPRHRCSCKDETRSVDDTAGTSRPSGRLKRGFRAEFYGRIGFFMGWSLEGIRHKRRRACQGSRQTQKPCGDFLPKRYELPRDHHNTLLACRSTCQTPSPQTYICRDPSEPPKTIILSSMTQEECPAMGGGPWVVTMQFHLGEEGGGHSPSGRKALDEWQNEKPQGPANSSRTRYRGKPQGKPPKIHIIMKLIRNTNTLNIFKA